MGSVIALLAVIAASEPSLAEGFYYPSHFAYSSSVTFSIAIFPFYLRVLDRSHQMVMDFAHISKIDVEASATSVVHHIPSMAAI